MVGKVNLPANLILLDMHDFNISLGIDWLAGHHATMECFTKVITFKLDVALMEVKFQGELKNPQEKLISALKASKLLRSGCQGHIAFITEGITVV